jgi:hypothetical protein
MNFLHHPLETRLPSEHPQVVLVHAAFLHVRRCATLARQPTLPLPHPDDYMLRGVLHCHRYNQTLMIGYHGLPKALFG